MRPRFPDGNNIELGQQYNVGEKPTVILYTYINRHAGTPEKQKKQTRNNVDAAIWGCICAKRLWYGYPGHSAIQGAAIEDHRLYFKRWPTRLVVC